MGFRRGGGRAAKRGARVACDGSVEPRSGLEPYTSRGAPHAIVDGKLFDTQQTATATLYNNTTDVIISTHQLFG
jgi:hypothetical protein